MTDVHVENHGTVFTFDLKSESARQWVEDNVSEPVYFGHALAVEHRFAWDLAAGMMSDGLTVN